MARDEARKGEGSGSRRGSKAKQGTRDGGSKSKAPAGEERAPGPSPLRPASSVDAKEDLVAGRAGVLEALEAGLAEALPGVEVLDRDLDFDGKGHADLIGVDPAGRIVIVLLAGEDTERCALDALDALAYARNQARLLERHLANGRVNADREPRLVVIDPAGDARLGERLVPLESSGIELLCVQTLRSATGERSYLVPHPDSEAARLGGKGDVTAAGIEAFFAQLPDELSELGQSYARRLSKLDADLVVELDRGSMSWSWRETLVARVECRHGGLLASIGPRGPESPLRLPEDVEPLLEGALALLVEAFEDDGVGGPGDRWGGEAGGSAAAVSAVRPVSLADSEEPILTQEEIQAFHG